MTLCVFCGERPVMVGPAGVSIYCSLYCKRQAKKRRRRERAAS